MNGYVSYDPVTRRILPAVLTAAGALSVLGFLIRFAAGTGELFSPALTAESCFHYPAVPVMPERSELSMRLLSSAFFGSEAGLFDSGEENTGVSNLPPPASRVEQSLPSDEMGPDSALSELSPVDLYAFDYTLLKAGELALLPYDLSRGAAGGEILFSNTTSLVCDADRALAAAYPITSPYPALRTGTAGLSDAQTEPLVLILHTHGTEAFAPEGAVGIPSDSTMRSSDPAENMVAVGSVMADRLNAAGVPTLHCETMHDLESYANSYIYSAETVRRYLKEYPSIQYIFDVHRDAIAGSSGDLVKPVCLVNGKPSAQVMLLVGTNEKGADHPDWEQNLSVAVRLQQKLTTKYDRFARPINIRGASFNEQYRPGFLLIEIGSAANSLSEAKNAASALADTIAELILENCA